MMMNEDHNRNGKNEESRTLKSLLGNEARVEWFFQNVWQEQCQEFRWKNRHSLRQQRQQRDASNDNTTNDCWDDDAVKESPYEEIVDKGWDALIQLLESNTSSTSDHSMMDEESHPHTSPIIFKNQTSVTNELLASFYNNSLFSAYLDGCSVVLNHADWRSPWIAALCLDLQKSFPHAYANVYITPPGSQAVRAHADDRDVIVIQVAGEKEWKIYQKVPIPHPYPREQVGKEGLEVPTEVLTGPTLIETTLRQGDALYMPRGYVHEAQANNQNFSFHVTIALATHDWTLAGILTNATENILHNVLDYRKAINRKIGMRNLNDISVEEKDQMQKQIHEAFTLLQERVTVETMSDNLEHKFSRHNHRAFSARMNLMHAMRFPTTPPDPAATSTVGMQAAKALSLDSLIRAATDEEKNSVMMDHPRGLRVREEVADAIINILTALKQSTTKQKDVCGGVAVKDLKSLLQPVDNANLICQLTLISFAKVCVAQGALAVVHQ